MKEKKEYLVLFLLVGFLLILPQPMNAQELRGITPDSIRVGLIADTSGVVADYGRNLLMGCSDYFRYINDKGGIHGRKIVLIHEDDQYKIPVAIAAFEKLVVKDEVLGIIHCGGTAQTMALMPKIQKEKVPILPPGTLDPFYKPYNRYIFVYGSDFHAQIEAVIDYVIDELKVKKPAVGIVYYPYEWTKESMRGAKGRLKAYGVDPVGEMEIPSGTVDATSQVLSMKKAGAEFVVMFVMAPGLINFIKTAEKFAYFPTYLTTTWGADDFVIKSCGKAAKNYYAGSIFGSWDEDTPGGREMREIAKKYGSSPKLPNLYKQGYTASSILTEGLRRGGRDLTVEKFVDALETFKDFDCGGMLCPMTYTPTIHKPSEYVKVFKADIEKLALVPVTGWVKPKILK